MRKMARTAQPATVTQQARPSKNSTVPRVPAPTPVPPVPSGKIGTIVAMLRQPEGTTIEAMMVATGWQAHSVRGALSGSVRKRLGMTLLSRKTETGRTYCIIEAGAA